MLRYIRVLTVVLTLALAACGQSTPSMPATSLLAGEALAPIDPAAIRGPIEITGSSTVYPLTARIAEEFHADGSPAQIEVKVTGTGGGLRSFCNGDDVDIVNASRPIADDEIAACRAVGREPVGFQVGVDALAVVVNPQNRFVEALSFAQLAQIFSGQATRWSQVDPSYPDEPIAVYSPGVDSGTFDYFVEEVLGDGAPLEALPGAVLSEDDTELVRGIEGNPNAIGYFGFAYYQAEGERLRAVPIDGGDGAVLPGEGTVTDGSYPLARPLFIYTSAQTLQADPATAAFVSYYLQSVGDVVAEVGYFPLPDAALSAAQQELVAALR
ncbi:MAG TPA: PstS family phosphate ABC transporter substrate-binding protein [Chloroflexaceae bacterium]|mgnify:CR=1 FL=1|nr:PstS family phosphate ABC transporter substrate-binding protein [Chloroflexaceae bacterium]